MKNQIKKWTALWLALVASLSACGGKTSSAAPDGSPAEPPVESTEETVTLVIGLPEHLQTVEVQTADKNPESLIAALAEETG